MNVAMHCPVGSTQLIAERWFSATVGQHTGLGQHSADSDIRDSRNDDAEPLGLRPDGDKLRYLTNSSMRVDR